MFSINLLKILTSNIQANRKFNICPILEAARKGTREKARKKKVKVEVKKVGFIPHNQREKNKGKSIIVNKHVDDSWKAIPIDNVYVGRYYRWKVYSVSEAIECHRETHHPTIYNVPDAPLNVEIELNMQAEKTTRFLDNFSKLANIPHKFDHGEIRNIIVFVKDKDIANEALNNGASIAGGLEIIKKVQEGEILLNDYKYIIAHPDIIPELVVLRGLLKRKFPNPRSGTLGIEISEMIHKFAHGISYSVTKDENQQNFGLISTCIGKLNMSSQHLEDNLASLLKDVNSVRPKRSGKFITRVLLKSPPSGEQLKIDPFKYIPEEYKKDEKSDIENENHENLVQEHASN